MGETPKKITKDMYIMEIFSYFSSHAVEIAEKMMSLGLHCFGCSSARFETLEQGMLAHGFTEEEIDIFVSELNLLVE